MEVALSRRLVNETNLFEQVGINNGPNERSSLLELKLNKFSKARGVVVTNGTSISKGFQNGVRLEDCNIGGTNIVR